MRRDRPRRPSTAASPGCGSRPARRHAGTVDVIDIGIPRGGPAKAEAGLISGGVLREMPRRGADSTKFSSGNVFILGGSSGLTGAPSMAALAAMRAGAGYVTVGAPASLELLVHGEAARGDDGRAARDRRRAVSREAVGPALKAIGRADAVVLGPGAVEGQGRARVRAGDVRARRRAARDRRGRAQRARGLLPGGPAAAAAGRPCSPRTRASSAACSGSTRRRSRARRLELGPRGGGQGARVRRAQGRRHARRLARRPRRDLARRRPGAGDRRHRRRALRRDRRDARQGPPARPRGLRRRSTRTSARARSPRRPTAPTA